MEAQRLKGGTPFEGQLGRIDYGGPIPLERLEGLPGTAAAAGGDWKAADAHFASAARLAESLPLHVERTEVRRYHAMMLLDRGAPGDRDVAGAELREAIAGYARVGMPQHEQLVRRLLER
jgi:hypothetical protein